MEADGQQTLNHLLKQELQYNLNLADGNRWKITAGNEEAASIVSKLGCAMQVHTTKGKIEPSHHGNLCRLLVSINTQTAMADCYIPLALKNESVVVCILSPCSHVDGLYVQLMQLSLVIARNAQTRGGVLIHGTLAERNGIGVILAAPGGKRKTTASNRLPVP